MYQFAAAQETSKVKLPAFCLRFQTEECVLSINKSKFTSENTFNGDYFKIEEYHGSGTDKKNLF